MMKTDTARFHKVTFSHRPKTRAQRAFLVGDFNGWDFEKSPMKMNNGTFETTLELETGHYSYRLLVDGRLFNDPAAEMQIWHGPGDVTSVIRVGAFMEQN